MLDLAVWKLKKGNFRWSVVRAYLLAICGFLYGAECRLVKNVPKKYLQSLDSLISRSIKKYFCISRGTSWDPLRRLLLFPKMELLKIQLKVRFYKILVWLNLNLPELKEATDFMLKDDYYRSAFEEAVLKYRSEDMVSQDIAQGLLNRKEITEAYSEPNILSNRNLSGKKAQRNIAAITGIWDNRQQEFLKYCTKVEICQVCGGGRF